MNKLIAGLATFAAPLISSAAVINSADDIISMLFRYGNIAINILISFAVLYLIYAIVRYVIMAGDAEKRGEAQSQILWGVVGLVVILSIWGLVRIVRNTFYTGPNVAPVQDYPLLQDRRF